MVRLTPNGVNLSCSGGWRGGVLLPDGKVLAIPYCADRMLLIDPDAKTVMAVGITLADPITGAPDAGPSGKYSGGVLGCDGLVYGAPHGENRILRVQPDAGFAVERFGFSPFGGPGRFTGAVVGPGCEIWSVGAAGTARWVMGPFGVATAPFPRPAVDDSNGLVRGVGGGFWAPGGTGNMPSVWRIDPCGSPSAYAGGLLSAPYRGGALGANGVAHFIQPDSGTVLGVAPDGGVLARERHSVAGAGFGWPAFRGDGFIYALGTALLAVSEAPDGGVFELLASDLAVAGASQPGSFVGLVATPSGVLVAIPSEFPDVLLFIPDGGATAPASVLLSPFFNKL